MGKQETYLFIVGNLTFQLQKYHQNCKANVKVNLRLSDYLQLGLTMIEHKKVPDVTCLLH